MSYCNSGCEDYVNATDERKQNLYNARNLFTNLNHRQILFVEQLRTDHMFLNSFLKSRPMNLGGIKDICQQILEVLSYLHTQHPPVIHGHLKCDNIVMEGTKAKIVLGNLELGKYRYRYWMAPEYYFGQYDEKADIWSFGMCVIEMITHQIPYEECDGKELYNQVLMDYKPNILQRIENPNIKSFIDICLNIDPNQRLQANKLIDHPFLHDHDSDRIPCEKLMSDPSSNSICDTIDNASITDKELVMKNYQSFKTNRCHKKCMEHGCLLQELTDNLRQNILHLEKILNETKNLPIFLTSDERMAIIAFSQAEIEAEVNQSLNSNNSCCKWEKLIHSLTSAIKKLHKKNRWQTNLYFTSRCNQIETNGPCFLRAKSTEKPKAFLNRRYLHILKWSPNMVFADLREFNLDIIVLAFQCDIYRSGREFHYENIETIPIPMCRPPPNGNVNEQNDQLQVVIQKRNDQLKEKDERIHSLEQQKSQIYQLYVREKHLTIRLQGMNPNSPPTLKNEF